MIMMTKEWCLLLIIILLINCIERIASANKPRLLIISLDGKQIQKMFLCLYLLLLLKGFRHDYLSKYSFPTINRIQNKGIKTKYGMQPTFVTMTFPNHISIATGRMKIFYFFFVSFLYMLKTFRNVSRRSRDRT